MKCVVFICFMLLFTEVTKSQPCNYEFRHSNYRIARLEAVRMCRATTRATSSMVMIKSQDHFRDVVLHLQSELGSIDIRVWVGAKPYSSSTGWRWLDDEIIPPETDGFPPWYVQNLQERDLLVITTEIPGNSEKRFYFNNLHYYRFADGVVCGTVPNGVENPCFDSPCVNEGNCTNVGCHFECQCPVTASGRTCDQCLSVDPCASNICLNGGTCIRNYCTSQYTCICRLGYKGRNCEECSTDPCVTSSCLNGGSCVRAHDCLNIYSCECPIGYGGLYCETCIVKQCFSSKCTNGATCIPSGDCSYNYTCKCTHGYEGTYCDKCIWNPCNNVTCEHGGTCITESSCTQNFSCVCTSFFTGKYCHLAKFILPPGSKDNCTFHFRKNPTSNYSTALYTCHQANAALTMIQTPEKQAILTNTGLGLVNENDLRFWVGGERIYNTWKWLDKSPIPLTNINGYPLWGKDRPENEEDRNYLFISSIWELSGLQAPIAKSFFWSNIYESFEIGFVCEKRLNGPSCNSFPCKNGGLCTTVGCSFYCTCIGKYVGKSCEQLPPEFSHTSPDSHTSILNNDFRLLCKVKGIPVPFVRWTLMHQDELFMGNISQVVSTMKGSPFLIGSNFSENEVTSILEISNLGLCLGPSYITCTASNNIPDSDISHTFNINTASYEPFQGSYYIFSSDIRVNASTAKTRCASEQSKLVSIVDRKTQNFIIKGIEKQVVERLWSSRDTWIGLLRHGTNTFKWENDENLTYTNWDIGQPHNNFDCTYMGEESKWKNRPCTDVNILTHYICEKKDRKLPTIVSLEAPFGSGNSSSVIVEFMSPQMYWMLKHRVIATDDVSFKFLDVIQESIHLQNEPVIVTVGSLKPKVEYLIKVSVTAKYCSKPVQVSASIRTSPSNVINAILINNATCMVTWNWPSAKLYEVWYFIISITKHPFAYTSVAKDLIVDAISKESFSANLSSELRMFSFSALPNRKHFIRVFAKSDPGNDTSSITEGTCIAPLRVITKAPTPFVSGGSGSLVTFVLAPFNGVDVPVSKGSLILLTLGDDRNTSCDIYDFKSDNNSTMKARQSTKSLSTYNARNLPLVSDKYYIFYTIATVLSENGKINVVPSEMIVKYINVDAVPLWIIASATIGILILGSILSTLVILIRRRHLGEKNAELLLDDMDIPTENFDILVEDMKKRILTRQEYTVIKFLKKTEGSCLVEIFLRTKQQQGVTAHGKMVTGSKLTPRQRQDFAIEVEVLRMIGKHPFVIQMYGLAVEPEKLTVIYQIGTNGSLLDYLLSMKPSLTSKNKIVTEGLGVLGMLKFSWQIAKGMDHIAELGLVHRALCCRKICLSSNFQCLISDFSVARKVKESDGRYVNHDLKVSYLERQWMAPEAYYEHVYSSDSDAYSLGVVIWEIFTYGCTPVEKIYPSDVKKSKLARPPYCPDGTFDLMERCWHAIPPFRPKFSEIHRKLKATMQHSMNYSPVYDNIKHLDNLYDNTYGNVDVYEYDDDEEDAYAPVYDSIVELRKVYSTT